MRTWDSRVRGTATGRSIRWWRLFLTSAKTPWFRLWFPFRDRKPLFSLDQSCSLTFITGYLINQGLTIQSAHQLIDTTIDGSWWCGRGLLLLLLLLMSNDGNQIGRTWDCRCIHARVIGKWMTGWIACSDLRDERRQIIVLLIQDGSASS